jgi:hypothetical protein
MPSLPKCRTLYPYDAADVDELTFQPGETIEIVKEGVSMYNLLCKILLCGTDGALTSFHVQKDCIYIRHMTSSTIELR